MYIGEVKGEPGSYEEKPFWEDSFMLREISSNGREYRCHCRNLGPKPRCLSRCKSKLAAFVVLM